MFEIVFSICCGVSNFYGLGLSGFLEIYFFTFILSEFCAQINADFRVFFFLYFLLTEFRSFWWVWHRVPYLTSVEKQASFIGRRHLLQMTPRFWEGGNGTALEGGLLSSSSGHLAQPGDLGVAFVIVIAFSTLFF